MVAANRHAFTAAWHEHEGRFLAYACRLCGGDRDQAHDLLAQVAVKLLTYIAGHDRPIVHPKALIFRTLKQLAIDGFRKLGRERQLYDRLRNADGRPCRGLVEPQVESPQRQLEARQQLRIIQEELSGLSIDMQALFVQRFLEERSYREIAERFMISNELARKRVQILRAHLSHVLYLRGLPIDFHIGGWPAS